MSDQILRVARDDDVDAIGVALYRAFDFQEVERSVLTMPDGVTIEAVAMERPIDPA